MASDNASTRREGLIPLQEIFTPYLRNSIPEDDRESSPSPGDDVSSPSTIPPDHHQQPDNQGDQEPSLGSPPSDLDLESDDGTEPDLSEPLSPTSEDGFGNEEDVEVAIDAYSWKVDHSTGHHRLGVHDFLSQLQDPQFDGSRAIEMVHQRNTIDYGSRKAGSRPTRSTDEYHPIFSLDMIIMVGRPMKPITHASNRFFDNVTLSFRNWRSSYSCKHIHGFAFDLQHRTFRLATAATRESWFIVFHPAGTRMHELPSSRRAQRQKAEGASKSSALRYEHAQSLAAYIKQLFLLNELLGEGVEESWVLDGPQAQTITFNKWTTFQEVFMENWEEYVHDHTEDPFWYENQPAFHAYDYGANIEIQVNDHLRSMPKLESLRPLEESSDEDDVESDDEAASTTRSPSHSSQTESRLDSHTDSRHEDVVVEETGEQDDGRPSERAIPVDFYPTGLAQLQSELEGKYTVQNISSISYAIAVDLNCLDGAAASADGAPARCLLANRNLVAREYRGARDFSFYPLAFHPAYGNFSSPRPPAFLDNNVLAVMKDNMSYLNGGADPLRYGYFQAYSNIKRSIRHGPNDLLATKGIATAALTLPESEASASSRIQAKRQRLRRQLLGLNTPEDPDASKPFARERRRLLAAIDVEEFPFRLEQVIHIQIDRLTRSHRRFPTILQPILHIIRFFLCEPAQYSSILHSFRPSVFPGILAGYAQLFDAALDELRQRTDARKAKGVDVALAEGVAALDRLGSYAFTGFPRSLMGSVMKPLCTIDGIEQGAWPYIDPRLLDLQAVGGSLNLALWPRGPKQRPVLMHVAALAYHYGPATAISRHTHVWFQELGGKDMTGPTRVTKFFEDFFQDLWLPQTVSFIKRHLERCLREEDRRRDVHVGEEGGLDLLANQRSLLERWAASRYPFSWREFEPIMSTLIAPYSPGSFSVSTKARQDHARELYQCSVSPDSTHKIRFATAGSTWFSILRHVLQHFSSGPMKVDHWVAAIAAAMLSNEIECVPGVYQARLSFRRVIRLIGHITPAAILSAPAGSLKRAAMEAQHTAKRQRMSRRVDFGCKIPFTQTPELVKQGFAALELRFQKGDPRIREHYQVARNCLDSCLGDPLCDLMLMLALTMASCSVTPTVAPQTRHFAAGARKDPALFAANLVTRMLWFLRPRHFPWKEDHRLVLRVPEMTKKIEHKGVSNRLLRELGWVKVARGNRDTPRNDELELQDVDKHLSLRKELLKLRKDAPAFIRLVFHSHDPIWVDRCSQIIQDEQTCV